MQRTSIYCNNIALKYGAAPIEIFAFLWLSIPLLPPASWLYMQPRAVPVDQITPLSCVPPTWPPLLPLWSATQEVLMWAMVKHASSAHGQTIAISIDPAILVNTHVVFLNWSPSAILFAMNSPNGII